MKFGDGLLLKGNGFTIKIVPDVSDTIHTIHLSAKMAKIAIASFGIMLLLFGVMLVYSLYMTFFVKTDETQVEEMRQISNMQQEQLLQLSKKADGLQQELDRLTQMENDLRRMSGTVAAPDAADPPADGAGEAGSAGDGQGGPYVKLDTKNVGASLDDLEKRVAVRRASLQQLKQILEEQQKEFAAFLPYSAPYALSGSSAAVPSMWPTRGEVSSPFGLRWNGSDFHPGIDIANDFGDSRWRGDGGRLECRRLRQQGCHRSWKWYHDALWTCTVRRCSCRSTCTARPDHRLYGKHGVLHRTASAL